MKNLQDFNVAKKRVLVRCDFNVSLDDQGNVLNDFKIKKTLPTIQHLLKHRAKIILMSHLDELENGQMPRMDSVAHVLEKLIGVSVKKVNDCVGLEVEAFAQELGDGEILLLENLRIHSEEKNNDENFAKKLASLGEIFINDAFAVCHRAHASVVGVTKFLPFGAGLLLQEELKNLDKILKDPARPLVVLVGGAKVKTKENFIEKITQCADLVLLGGLLQKEILEHKIHFTHSEKIIAPEENLGAEDLDKKTIEKFQEKIKIAKTILWNGPFGYIQEEGYTQGTRALAQAIIASGAFSVVGGGQTIEFLEKEHMLDKFGYVSTGGGAMLDYLSDGQLPGLDALE